MLGLSVISRGSTGDKLRWVFNLYDTDQDGYLSRNDLSNIVTAVYNLIGSRPSVDRNTIDDKVLYMLSVSALPHIHDSVLFPIICCRENDGSNCFNNNRILKTVLATQYMVISANEEEC